MAVFAVVLLLLMAEPGISQSNISENNINTPIGSFCGHTAPIIQSNFLSNRNSTFSQIRSQLSSNNAVYYARAQSLSDGDSVFGVLQCRKYLTATQCLACYDAAVSQLESCTTGNGAYIFFDNCYFRYTNYIDFYTNPNVIEDAGIIPLGTCGTQSTSQPVTTFNQDVDQLLSSMRDATPRTPGYYVAQMTQVPSNNATVYAIAQCLENVTQTICQNCLNTAYSNLYNCLPNTEGRSMDMGCFMRYSETQFFNDNQTTAIASFLKKGHSSMVVIIAATMGGVCLVLIILLIWYRHWKKSKKTEEDSPNLKGAINYNYKDLLLATDNFSEKNVLGKGGYGEVFKATLGDGELVAVKKLQVGLGTAKIEFENEVNLISDVRHRNLLRLLGWSSEGSDLLLVLEYMPAGSLDRFLWGPKRGVLNWKARYDIIFGIARGLAHLHAEFHVKIIHRDIKSSNILLDDDYQPKIADFGLAKFLPEDQTHVTTKFAGTLGYTAPEYALNGLLSDKVDTYSFGIVTLEIISGRRCTDVSFDRPSTDYLLEHAWKLYENNIHTNFIDETMNANEYDEEQVKRIIEISLLCTQSPVSIRPTMPEVVLMLSSGQSLEKKQLTRPTFIDHDRRVQIGTFNNRGNLEKQTN